MSKMLKTYSVPSVRVINLFAEGVVCTSKFTAGEDPEDPDCQGHEGYEWGGSIWDAAGGV